MWSWIQKAVKEKLIPAVTRKSEGSKPTKPTAAQPLQATSVGGKSAIEMEIERRSAEAKKVMGAVEPPKAAQPLQATSVGGKSAIEMEIERRSAEAKKVMGAVAEEKCASQTTGS